MGMPPGVVQPTGCERGRRGPRGCDSDRCVARRDRRLPARATPTGNVATEDLVYALERIGSATGHDVERSIESARWIAGELRIQPPGMVARAGAFP